MKPIYIKAMLRHWSPLVILATLLFSTAVNATVKQGLEWAQQGEWWEAEPYFLAEANKGDPEAMFWLAKTHMRMGGEKIFGLGYLMLQSAELGYPWAMMELVDGPETYCSFFRLPCDDEWYDKAIEKW
ncbi:hypothetical protein D1Z90_19875 [Motilimonas pumila]|uniref:Sel1 repeat family protein n=2 Tax=Motilimonas pumila TaxID=2303987 RepID=A0A418Y9E6_9GAMM|nr:hypothetical protein D1Z90_19875 [Motilimonas pumila]